jgi:hypothetical protein
MPLTNDHEVRVVERCSAGAGKVSSPETRKALAALDISHKVREAARRKHAVGISRSLNLAAQPHGAVGQPQVQPAEGVGRRCVKAIIEAKS